METPTSEAGDDGSWSGGGRGPGRGRTLALYGLVLALAAMAFWGIRTLGADLVAPPTTEALFGSTLKRAHTEMLLHLLVALVVIILASRLLGAVFGRLQQPAVIGEVIAGILLGPSALGRLFPEAYAFLLPPTVAPFLQALAQVGIILFMFLVGLELDIGLLRKKTEAAFAISHASIIAPFLLGSLLALWLYPRLSNASVPFPVFAMFMGVSMSVTAFPVLARILTDRGMQRTRLGVIAISCAAVDDVTAWCLLAFVVGIAQANPGQAVVTIAASLVYVAVMLLVVRPIVVRLLRRQEVLQRLGRGAASVVLIGLLVSSLITEAIGIHALFGAFLLGAILPHDSMLARDLKDKIEDLVVVMFLPAFFAYTGMRTQIGLVDGWAQWLYCGAVICVACVGKFGGSAIAARLSGLSWREAASLGVLMNTRGLMELIVLNLGLDLHVISPTLFAMMVLMAIVTTCATTPLLHLLTRDRSMAKPPLVALPRE